MLLRAVNHRLGRLEDRGGRVSMSGKRAANYFPPGGSPRWDTSHRRKPRSAFGA